MNDYERLVRLEVRVRHIEAMMQALLTRLGINPSELEAQTPPLPQPIQEALRAGDTLKAITLYRQMYGVSLEEARNALEGGQGGPFR